MSRHPNSNQAKLDRDEKITRPVKPYRYGDKAGCVITSKSRETGKMVSVYHNHQAGLDDTTPWSTTCEEHSINVSHDSLKLAMSHLSNPLGWCDECRLMMKERETP